MTIPIEALCLLWSRFVTWLMRLLDKRAASAAMSTPVGHWTFTQREAVRREVLRVYAQ